jgi:hypothetical protein
MTMKEFTDAEGRVWIATVEERPGLDYKGRFHFRLEPKEGGGEEAVALEDIRWNSRGTAERTLATMSGVELRRRLRSAVGRAGALPAPD